ncbi:hypothetical protein V7V80_07725 [Pseudomonas kermanshahensis]|uniref:Uncharacterized protein n=1 Tax=Pseudomonas kermanshahensis TaxID=2745482 RepID=A0ABU8R3Y2_9PSED
MSYSRFTLDQYNTIRIVLSNEHKSPFSVKKALINQSIAEILHSSRCHGSIASGTRPSVLFWQMPVASRSTRWRSGLSLLHHLPASHHLPYLKNLTHTELFSLLGLIVIVVFGVCLALINASRKPAAGSNTINIEGSTVHGNVQAGNNTTHEKQ